MRNTIWIALAVQHLPAGAGGVVPCPEITHQPVAIVARDEVAARVKATLKFGLDPDDRRVEVVVAPFA